MEAYTKAEVDSMVGAADHIMGTIQLRVGALTERLNEQATLIEGLRNLIPADSVKLKRPEPEGEESESPAFKAGDIVTFRSVSWLVEHMLVGDCLGLWRFDGPGGRIPVHVSYCKYVEPNAEISEEIQRMSEFVKEQESYRNRPPEASTEEPAKTEEETLSKHGQDLVNSVRAMGRALREEPAKTTGLTRDEARAVLDAGGKIRGDQERHGTYLIKVNGVVCACGTDDDGPYVVHCPSGVKGMPNGQWEVVDD